MDRLARLMVLSVTVCTLALTSTAYATTVGRTQGSFAVSPTGAATYNIPIWAPPGPKGIQPSVSLVYNSQAGNGYVGMGWNLAGLSSISRCNLTYAQDAAPAAVSLSTSDGYCLDGQRLRLTGGTYGTAGSTYQTEIANFANVTAYGTAGNGPAYFIVQTPDGRTLQYGEGGSASNAQVLANGTSTALAWMLNEVSDPAGNTMTISYSTSNGVSEVVPLTISWTPTSHGAASYAYTMTFGYGVNPNTTNGVNQSSTSPCRPSPTFGRYTLAICILNGYVAGATVQEGSLLNSITIDYNGSQVKEYVLTYTQSGTTGRDTLTQVQECAASTTNCLYPTTISYQGGSAGVSTTATTVTGASTTNFIGHYDLNGDGYTDLVYSNGTSWYVAFGSASGYGTAVNTGISASYPPQFGDFLGTGRDGMLAKNGSTWYYYTWNGSSFIGTSTGLAYDTTAVQFALADVNGDGRPDLVSLYSVGSVTTRLNTSTGTTPSFASSVVTTVIGAGGGTTELSLGLYSPDTQSENTRFFDFNGDGLQDLAVWQYICTYSYMGTCYQNYYWIAELISQPGGTFLPTTIYSNPTPITGSMAFANLNDDACTDAFLYGATVNTVYISPCNGSAPASLTPTYPIVAVMDWNGDGLADLLENNGGTLYVQLATATGFGAATATSIPYSTGCAYMTFDSNGDGLDDLGCTLWSSGGFKFYPHNDAGTPPDLLTNVTDGFGNYASPSYASIVQSNYSGAAGTYPDVPYLKPLYVAKSVTYSDPSSTSGGTYSQTYYYHNSFVNIQGRGWDGFGDHDITDSRTGLTEYIAHWIAFPYASLPDYDNVYSGSQQISEYQGTPAVNTLSSTPYQQRYFPYLSNITTQQWEFGGTENGVSITTGSTNYTYDSYGNATTIAESTTDNDPGSPYHGYSWTATVTNTPDISTSPWCLNLFTQTQVTFTASVGSPVTRTKQYTPDLTNCHYTQIVTEPSSGTYKVTEALGYDAFNNISSDTVTGIGMSGRTTTSNWGGTGQLPISVTDPSSAQTLFGYNYSFGIPSTTTDPNGLVTSWTYGDGFGRKTQENRPDSTYTTWTYNDCPGWGGCITGSHGLSVAHYIYSTTGTIISDGTDYYDTVDRSLSSNWSALAAGTWNRIDVRYDSLGRKAQVYAPCVYVSNTTPCPYSTSNTYDVLNRLIRSQRPISSTNSTLQTTSYAYAGRSTTVTDPNANQSTLITDVNGWRRQTKDPLSYAIDFGYDAAGSPTSVTDSLSNTLWTGSYIYGLQAFLTNSNDMDLGSWGSAYDALGERTSWTDAKGQNFSATYDALGRLTSRSEPDLFTQWTWGSSTSNHNWGQLQSDCTGTGSTCTAAGYSESFVYDSLGRPSQRAITIPSTGTFTYTMQFDATTGLLSTLTYPTSTSGYALEIQYGYASGILQSVTDISDPTHVAVWTANSANPAGQVTQETLGNGIVTNRAYDAVTHWLGSVTSGLSGGSGTQNQGFLYDEVGNVILRQDNNLGLNENFYYDSDYRLTSTKLNGTTNFSLTYDALGNITSRSDILGGASWTYDPAHKHQALNLGGAVGYAYDANGNATSRGGGTVGWTSYNYPTTATVVSAAGSETTTFAYAPDRSRWMQGYSSVNFGNPATTYYIGGLMELVNSGGVNTYRYYIDAGSEPVAVYSRTSSGTNAFNYFLSDHQGTVAGITSSSGTTVVAESYTPFGLRRVPSTWVDPAITATGWTNQVSDADMIASTAVTSQGYTFQTGLGLFMGLNHMNGRVQDAISGRFLSADPAGIDENNTQSFNRYSYVTNNPLTLLDPSGFYSGFPCTSASSWCPVGPSCAGTCDMNGLGALPDIIDGFIPGGGQIGTDTGLQEYNNGQQAAQSANAQLGQQASDAVGAALNGAASTLATAQLAQYANQSGSGATVASDDAGDGIADVLVRPNCLECLNVAYPGSYHDVVVAYVTAWYQSNGYVAESEIPVCFEGTCTRVDVLVQSPATKGLFAVEVKTGKDPPFTENQAIVYPHLPGGGLVTSTTPRISAFGLLVNSPLPPTPVWLYYVATGMAPGAGVFVPLAVPP